MSCLIITICRRILVSTFSAIAARSKFSLINRATTYNLSDSLPSYPLTPMRTDYGDRSKGNVVFYAQLDKLLSADQIRKFLSRVGALSYLSLLSRQYIYLL